MSLKKQAAKGVIWSVLEGWGRQVISSIVFFVLARLLGPESFGLIALASTSIALFQLFLEQGFSEAIIQRKDIEPEHLDTTFWTNIGVGLALTTASIMAAKPISLFYDEPLLFPILCWLSLGLLIGSFSGVQKALLRRQLKFRVLAIRSIISIIAGSIVGLTMAVMGFGVWSLVGQQLANSLVQVVVLWSTSKWFPSFKFSKKHFKDLFSFGLNVLGIRILNFLNRRSDDLLIGYFLGPVALGYYNIAYKVLLIMTDLLISVIGRVALPTFSRLQDDLERLRDVYYKTTQLSSFVAFPAFLSMTVLAPEIVLGLFGPKWAPSIPVMQILSTIGILHSLYYFNGSVIMAMGKPKLRLYLNCITSIVNIIGFFIAVRWGILAVASTYVIRGYLLSPLPLLVMRNLIKINFKRYLTQIVTPMGCSLVMILAILLFKHSLYQITNMSVYIVVISSAIIGIVLYLLLIRVFSPKLFHQAFSMIKLVTRE